MNAPVPAVVLGGTGYVAGELLRLLAGHPRLRLAAALSDSQSGGMVESAFPHLAGCYPGLAFSGREDLARIMGQSMGEHPAVALLCAAPHGAAAPLLDEALTAAERAGTELKVVDVSADFRFADGAAYAAVYGHPHGAPGRLAEFQCALPEHLAATPAGHVGHPGCFVTATLLAAVPLLKLGLLVDFGFVGDVEGVDPKVLTDLMDAGYVPVVSPLSAAEDGTVLNINADTIASALAVALQAEKLLFLTGAPGILERADDPGSLVSYTDLAGLRRLKDEGGLLRGMLPKTSAIEAAIQGGVRRVHILSHDLPDGLLAEVFTNEGVGTLVVEDVRVLSPAEAAAGAAATPVPALTGVGAV